MCVYGVCICSSSSYPRCIVSGPCKCSFAWSPRRRVIFLSFSQTHFNSAFVLGTPAHLLPLTVFHRFNRRCSPVDGRWVGRTGSSYCVSAIRLRNLPRSGGSCSTTAERTDRGEREVLFFGFPDKNTRSVAIIAIQRARTNSNSLRNTVNNRVLPPI